MVFGVFLVLVGVTATLQTALVSLHFSTAAVNATVAADAAIVRTFANGVLTTADLAGTPDPARVARLEADLAALAARAGLDRVDVRDVPAPYALTTRRTRAAAQRRRARLRRRRRARRAPRSSCPVASPTPHWRDRGSRDPARVPAAGRRRGPHRRGRRGLARRQADPAALGRVQEQMLAVTLAAAVVAALVLSLVFRAAQVRIGRQTVQLLEATRRDPLTGMLNHGALVTELTEALDRARAVPAPIGVALLDLDNFRLLNDTHGHEAGDAALVRLARAVERHLPPQTTAGRYGPDEFLLIAPAASIALLPPAIERFATRSSSSSSARPSARRSPSAPVSPPARPTPTGDGAAFGGGPGAGEARASGGDAVRVAEQAVETSADAQAFSVLQGLVFTIDTMTGTQAPPEDVARYAVFLARRMGLEPSLIEALRVAGLLHDVGKVGIPEAILRKPGS
jgi:diguanylate cyclase (GGDEF)-like protein